MHALGGSVAQRRDARLSEQASQKLGNATYRADKALLCITLPTGPLGLLMMPRGANSPEAN